MSIELFDGNVASEMTISEAIGMDWRNRSNRPEPTVIRLPQATEQIAQMG